MTRYLNPNDEALTIQTSADLWCRAAEALRVAVALRGPQPAATLVDAAEQALRGLNTNRISPLDSTIVIRAHARQALHRIIDDRDLVRRNDPSDVHGAALWHAHPLCVVAGSPTRQLLIGVDLAGQAELSPYLEAIDHRRWLTSPLMSGTLPALAPEVWIGSPSDGALKTCVDDVQGLINGAGTHLGNPEEAQACAHGKGWVSIDNAGRGPHVVRFRGRWGQTKWWVTNFDQAGQPGRALALPHASLPDNGNARSQAYTLHLQLSRHVGQPATYSIEGAVLRLSAMPPSWLARRLDLLGVRASGTLWKLQDLAAGGVEAVRDAGYDPER